MKKVKQPALPEIFSPKVREAWDLPQELSVSSWADQSIVLDEKHAEPGLWRTSRTPYAREIMDAFADPLVEDIILMTAAQIVKTSSWLNMLGYAADQDPGPALVVMPREDDAKSICYNRIIPMFRNSPRLSRHLPKNSDDVTKMEVRLDRMTINMAGANSPAALAQRAIRYLFFDEVDKYPPFSGREADPIDLAEERTSTFWNCKKVKSSTPTLKTGFIYREWERTDRRRYYVPCPHCSTYQVFILAQIKWPKEQEERDPERIRERRLAWYECIECKGKIYDAHKTEMLERGKWVPEVCGIDKKGNITGEIPRTTRRGYTINAIYSVWRSFSDVAAKFLNSKDDPEKLMNFTNSWMAEPWTEGLERTDPEKLAKLALVYEKATVPADVQMVLGSVDAQRDHYYCQIDGWAAGMRSYRILSMRVETLEEVEKIMFNTDYPLQENNDITFPVLVTAVDTGDRTEEMYEFCRKWSDRARPIKGVQHLHGMPFSVSTIDRMPRTGTVIPGGMKLWKIDTSFYKDKISRLIRNTSPENPSGWYLYANPPEDYLKQMCSEQKTIRRDKSGKVFEEWVPIRAKQPNHFLDCEVYLTALADMCHVFTLPKDGSARQNYAKMPEKVTHEKTETKESWIPKRSGWLKSNG